jgi:hypothetical protein
MTRTIRRALLVLAIVVGVAALTWFTLPDGVILGYYAPREDVPLPARLLTFGIQHGDFVDLQALKERLAVVFGSVVIMISLGAAGSGYFKGRVPPTAS